MSIETVYALFPELILIVAATLIYVAGAFWPTARIWSMIGLAGVVLAALVLAGMEPQAASPAGADTAAVEPPVVAVSPVVFDLLAYDVRMLVLVVGGLFLLLSAGFARTVQMPEFVGSLILIIAGLMLVATASDLVLLFAGLELVSIPTYILLFLSRRDLTSQEATAKYFFLSVLSSAVLLYGFSFLYGASGSTLLSDIARAVEAGQASPGVANLARVAMVLVFAGLGFRLAAVPFHFYAPDVYQGTNQVNAALLSIVPKIAGLVALVRIAVLAMPGLEQVGWKIALVMSVLTMTLGNLVALWQNKLRRILAYSSIAHAGYLLIGIAVAFAAASEASPESRAAASAIGGLSAALFYLVTYVLATIGAFAVLTYLDSGERPMDSVDDLAGVGWSHPGAGVCLAICMFSLTGIPPMVGFWGKLSLFMGPVELASEPASSSLRFYFAVLAIAGVLNAAISAAYYLRIVAVSYFRPSAVVPLAAGGRGAALAMGISAVLVVLAGLVPGPLGQRTSEAGRDAVQQSLVESAATESGQELAQAKR